jgi:hypothetical protein
MMIPNVYEKHEVNILKERDHLEDLVGEKIIMKKKSLHELRCDHVEQIPTSKNTVQQKAYPKAKTYSWLQGMLRDIL